MSSETETVMFFTVSQYHSYCDSCCSSRSGYAASSRAGGRGKRGVVVEEVADFRVGVIGPLPVCDIGLAKLVGSGGSAASRTQISDHGTVVTGRRLAERAHRSGRA